MEPTSSTPTTTNNSSLPLSGLDSPQATIFQHVDQAEAQTAKHQRPPSKRSNSSLALTFAIFFLIAALLTLHFCLDDPSMFLLFENYDSRIVPTADINCRDSWIKGTGNDTNLAPVEYQVIPPTKKGDPSRMWTFVLLHGLGDYKASESFRIRDALIHLKPDLFDSMRFIIPSAGLLPITVFGGQLRSAWFDIKNWTNVHQHEDLRNMKQNVFALNHILDQNHLDFSRTIIGGFSQGAVMSLLLSLTLENPPAGVIMLSGYTPIPEELLRIPSRRRSRRKPDLYWFHGDLDPYFKINFAQKGYDFISKKLSFSSDLSTFHKVSELDHNWSLVELNLLVHSLLENHTLF